MVSKKCFDKLSLTLQERCQTELVEAFLYCITVLPI